MASQQVYPTPPPPYPGYQPQQQNPYPQPLSQQYPSQPVPQVRPQEPPPPYGAVYPNPTVRYIQPPPHVHDPAACHAAQLERAAHNMDHRRRERRMDLGMAVAGVPHAHLIGLGMRIVDRIAGRNEVGEHAHCGESRRDRREARREVKALRRDARRHSSHLAGQSTLAGQSFSPSYRQF